MPSRHRHSNCLLCCFHRHRLKLHSSTREPILPEMGQDACNTSALKPCAEPSNRLVFKPERVPHQGIACSLFTFLLAYDSCCSNTDCVTASNTRQLWQKLCMQSIDTGTAAGTESLHTSGMNAEHGAAVDTSYLRACSRSALPEPRRMSCTPSPINQP